MSGTTFIHGFHAITARLRLDAKSVHELYCDSVRADPRMRDLMKLAEGLKLRVLQVDTRRLDDAAGCHAVIAPKDRAVGLSATAIKVASGAADSVPYVAVTNLARTLRELKERNIWVVGADSGANEDLYSAQLPAALAWVLGAEGEGLRRLTRETCDQLVKIPMLGQVESLNVSVASGVVLFESRRRYSAKT